MTMLFYITPRLLTPGISPDATYRLVDVKVPEFSPEPVSRHWADTVIMALRTPGASRMVVQDCRTLEEMAWIPSFGGVLVWIEPPSKGRAARCLDPSPTDRRRGYRDQTHPHRNRNRRTDWEITSI